ncbi:hypothetical protein M758_UG186000 [Ceratodon purpureus]|nr:hypothetical protein M758_UG186000 [Ceratodon purpureus]
MSQIRNMRENSDFSKRAQPSTSTFLEEVGIPGSQGIRAEPDLPPTLSISTPTGKPYCPPEDNSVPSEPAADPPASKASLAPTRKSIWEPKQRCSAEYWHG